MKNIILVVVAFFCSFKIYAQSKINTILKNELDSIYILDQKYRELLDADKFKTKTDSIATVYKVSPKELTSYLRTTMNKVDISNMKRVTEIIQQYGYPGASLVGTPTNEVIFYVIQHSDNIEKYLPLIKKAANKNELPFMRYAMMLDRSLMQKGKEQIYGTQGKGFEVVDSKTNEKKFILIIWSIKNPKSVNKRRKKAGFKTTVEENAKNMGIEYKVLTLKDYQKLQGK